MATPFRVTDLLILPTDYSGPPTTGFHEMGENIVDKDGVSWSCIVTGVPGDWILGGALQDFSYREVNTPFTCGYYKGKIRVSNLVTDVPDGTVAVANGVNYISVHGDGVVEANLIGFPANALPMLIVTVVAGAITNVQDRRAYFSLSVPDSVTNVYNEIPAGAIDGTNRVFTTAFPFVMTTTQLSLRGIRQELNISYTELSNTQVRFDDAPLAGDGIYIDYVRLF